MEGGASQDPKTPHQELSQHPIYWQRGGWGGGLGEVPEHVWGTHPWGGGAQGVWGRGSEGGGGHTQVRTAQ